MRKKKTLKDVKLPFEHEGVNLTDYKNDNYKSIDLNIHNVVNIEHKKRILDNGRIVKSINIKTATNENIEIHLYMVLDYKN